VTVRRRRWERLWRRPPWADPSWHLEPPPPELVRLVEDGGAIPGGAALDVGCGAGAATGYLAKSFHPAVGMDFVEAAIDEARRVAELNGSHPSFLLGEAPLMPFRSEAFSLVFDRGCFQNVGTEDWASYFGEMDRLLVPGGVLQVCITRPVRRFPSLLSFVGVKRRLGWLLRRRSRPHFPSRNLLQELTVRHFALVKLEEFPFQPRRGPLCTMTLAVLRKAGQPTVADVAQPVEAARHARQTEMEAKSPGTGSRAFLDLDRQLLSEHRLRIDHREGIREEFLHTKLGSGTTIGVLARPLGPALSVGWVLCHSFGIEEMNLDRLHVLVARRLAAAGFPTLRFVCQGYGDSERRGHPSSLLDHLEGTLDAVGSMGRQQGVSRVALFGTRFGALTAALVAERTGISTMAMCQPFARGDLFLSDCFQPALLREAIGRKQQGGVAKGMRHDLEAKGWADVDGFLLTREAWEEIAMLDITRALTRFHGSALVIGVSRNGTMPRGPAEVAGHLRSLGADCHEVGLADRWALVFGQHQYQKLPDLSEIDTQFELSRVIARSVVDWALERVKASASLVSRAGP
jgi:SAM-dependent methyltransferase